VGVLGELHRACHEAKVCLCLCVCVCVKLEFDQALVSLSAGGVCRGMLLVWNLIRIVFGRVDLLGVGGEKKVCYGDIC
jgi:hypothetical protein